MLAPLFPVSATQISLVFFMEDAVIENAHSAHQRIDKEAGNVRVVVGIRKRKRKECVAISARPDVCFSLVCLSGILNLAAAASKEGEVEAGEGGGWGACN